MRKIFSLMFAAVLAVVLVACSGTSASGNKVSENAKYLDLKIICEEYIPRLYYRLIQDDAEVCVNAITNVGMAEYLDKNTRRLTPEDTTEERNEFAGVGFGGVGAALGPDKNGAIRVIELIDGGTAEPAGLRIGDLIVEVEVGGKFVPVDAKKGVNLKKAVDMIRGAIGTTVKIAITRGGVRRELTMPRAKIVPKQVRYRTDLLNGKIGYVKITSFGNGTVAQQFEAAVDAVIKKGARSLLLDVRNNPGGLLDQAEEIISLFEKDKGGILVSVADFRKGEPDYENHTVKNSGSRSYGKYAGIPVVVLVNEHSASASEIFTAFMKYKGAVIVGVKSYGKGTVQQVMPLPSGGSIHITIKEYFVGDPHIKVDGVSVTPDHEVKNPEERDPLDEATDLQLKKAVDLLGKH